MPCRIAKLMMLCVILSLASCAHAPVAVDSFCQIYNPVVAAKGDGTITATAGAKKRLLANELTYRQLCKSADN
jgi:hypothetical protein